LVYGVSATDPLSLVTVAVLLLLVGLAASALPARRAAGVEPNIVLKE
jgi:ABC-type lipoprotein release transport system permease subunit